MANVANVWFGCILLIVITIIYPSRSNTKTPTTFGILCASCSTDDIALNPRSKLADERTVDICVCYYENKICKEIDQDIVNTDNAFDAMFIPSTIASIHITENVIFGRVIPLSESEIDEMYEFLCCSSAYTKIDSNLLIDKSLHHTDKRLPFTDNIHIVTTSVIKDLQWKYSVIIHDNYTASATDLIAEVLSLDGVSHIRYNTDTMADWIPYTFMQQFYDNLLDSGINVTVICQYACVEKILSQADRFDMLNEHKQKTAMNQKSRWLVVTALSTYSLQKLQCNITNLDNILLLNLNPSNNLQRKKGEDAFKLQDDIWVNLEQIFEKNNSEDSALMHELIKNFTRQREKFECDVYSLQTLMWSNNGRSFNDIGYATSSGKLHVHDNYFPNTKFGFNGRRFLVTTNEYPPFVIKETKNNTTRYSGFCIDLLKELARQLNFTYHLTEPADREWGKEGPNGTWTGMIGQLQAEEVDLMVAPASLHPGREMVMDFTYPFYFDSSTFMMRRPDPNQNKWFTLISPLRWQVLISIVALLPICAIFLSLFERYDPNGVRPPEQRTRYLHFFWYMFGALLQEGGKLPKLSTKGRIMISFWWIFSMILVAAYSGNLVAFLTVTKTHPPFTTFDGLASQTEYKWSVLEGTIFLTMFKNSPLQTYQTLWQGLERENASNKDFLHPDPNVHVERILTQDYVLIECKSYFEVKSATDCRLLIAEEEIPNMSFAVGLPNNSPFTEIFSHKILELHESGILQIIKEQNWPKRNLCKDSLKNNVKAISLIDLQSAFYLLAAGFIVALSLLSLERLCYHVKFLSNSCNNRCL